VSSAAHRLAGARVVTTARTLELARALGGVASDDVLVTPFARPFLLGRLRVELLPSGHAPGGAQLLVERPGRRLLYAGRVNPRAGRLAEPAQVRGCDALVLDAPLAAPATLGRALPERAREERALVDAVHGALERGETPVVLAPELGAAEEVAALLGSAGLPLRAHPRVLALLGAYVRMGLAVRTPARALKRASDARPGEVVLWPLERHASPALGRFERAHRLLAAGEALDPRAAARFGCAQAFALADDGDVPQLVEHARACGARDVYLVGAGDPAVRAFAAHGLRVHALGPPEQMRLFHA
jgi:putative mRNA 3-end processing factor